MRRRTTIEIDEDLLERAKGALGEQTTRATVEKALRMAADAAEGEHADRAKRQTRYLKKLDSLVDAKVLASEEMWR